jgi:hypothetical protein
MPNHHIDLHLHNQSLKSAFAVRGLDLSQVWQPTPDDLERENCQLERLLEWVEKYETCPDRAQMEAEGYEFPPVYPGIDPDSDWLCFELWMQNKPVRAKMKEQLNPPAGVSLAGLLKRDPQEMTDVEIEIELEKLYTCLENTNFSIDLTEGLPARFVYTMVREALEEEFEFIVGGGWHIDGCSGVCPECLQRPWCKSGQELCWREDEEAGEIHFPEAVRRYVSPSPVSLALLQKSQAEHDRRMKPYLDSDTPL